ncbi:MAG: RagB/SusD family nutrient uptake outer membrane protein [Bacteroidetes bacterium]|jgi:starch-binding outer membrane protein, SusD/RagB family|nr:RagB/SusD family nutrient uptake outer membrane protein [Bacteroidota bacterium]
MMKKNILLLLISVFVLSGCDDLFTPSKQYFNTIDQIYTNPSYAQNFLTTGYMTLPAYYDNSECATDDAVANVLTDSYVKMATGAWSSSNNPLSLWNNDYAGIQYLNLFLENVDKVVWVNDSISDPNTNELFARRMKGEAYGLRAAHLYFLLRNHAGVATDGSLLGVPLHLKSEDLNSDFNQARSTLEACVQQIYQDLDSAELYLPMEYNDLPSTGTVPAKFQDITTTVSTYNRVMGLISRQLFNGLIAKSFRARTALLAASPAYQDASNTTTWAMAADNAAAVIDYNIATNGVQAGLGVVANGSTYYTNDADITAASSNGVNPKEIIWREGVKTNNSDQEKQNFPPSIGGRGYVNPSQSLVDAFPMANGYPITDPNSGYDPTLPYTGRDPLFYNYIIYNGALAGSSNDMIYTGTISGAAADGINVRIPTSSTSGGSTRTGYYMKKRLNMGVSVKSTGATGKTHYTPKIRYTEIYLDYAEAANEAWGPKGTGTHSYSAYDVMKSIRKRSNPSLNSADPYLDDCAGDKDKMRELIHNARRIELCFESFRFWDLRRWKVALSALNAEVTGMDVNVVNGSLDLKSIDVENRTYKDYMYYGPIPYSEVLKYSNLFQNQGW